MNISRPHPQVMYGHGGHGPRVEKHRFDIRVGFSFFYRCYHRKYPPLFVAYDNIIML